MKVYPNPTRSLCGFLLGACLAAGPAVAAKENEWLAQASPTRNTAQYQRAKKELPELYYQIYRVVDKLARANGLDQSPWRIRAIPKYDVNAYATEVNLIAVFAGMVDMIAGDEAAMACVIGHEMAHHTQRHIPQGVVDAELAKQRVAERQQALAKEQEKRQSSRQGAALLQGLIRSAIGIDLPLVEGNSETDRAEMNTTLQTAAESEQVALLEKNRAKELEADRIGYMYMARAGFDPQGCLRFMDLMSRGPSSVIESTHPAMIRRLEAMKMLIKEIPAQPLANEGRARLMAMPALTYALSEDRQSLRVNSRYGSRKGGFMMNDL